MPKKIGKQPPLKLKSAISINCYINCQDLRLWKAVELVADVFQPPS